MKLLMDAKLHRPIKVKVRIFFSVRENQMHLYKTKPICISVDKNHLHYYQFPTTYRVVK